MTQPVTAVLFGAGLRGADAYAPYALAHPDELKFVAVAEPDPVRRARFAAAYDIPPERQFTTWEAAMAQPKIADAVFNTKTSSLTWTTFANGLRWLREQTLNASSSLGLCAFASNFYFQRRKDEVCADH
jgi:hypothetical protein